MILRFAVSFITSIVLYATAFASDLNAPGGRLTLVPGVPVTVADVSGANIAYFTPMAPGAAAPITTDGVTFTMVPFAELQNDVADATTNPAPLGPNHLVDFFLWSNAGVMTFTRGQPWTSDNVRANELQLSSGVLVNSQAITNGPAAGMGTYAATCRSNAAGQLVDTASTRWCWNAYNWQRRQLKRVDAAAPFVYNNATQWQPYNGNPANQLDWVTGLVGSSVFVTETVGMVYTGHSSSPGLAIFVDGSFDVSVYALVSPTFSAPSVVPDMISPSLPGRHYAAAFQTGGGPTTTWYGPLVMLGDIWN